MLDNIEIYDSITCKRKLTRMEKDMTIKMQDDILTDSVTITKVKIEKPKKYHVVFLNDDFTPMDFVVHVLREIFNKSLEEASALMLQVHVDDRAIIGTYSYEIAEQKVYETFESAKLNEYALQAIIEEEDPN